VLQLPTESQHALSEGEGGSGSAAVAYHTLSGGEGGIMIITSRTEGCTDITEGYTDTTEGCTDTTEGCTDTTDLSTLAPPSSIPSWQCQGCAFSLR
jgi:hypothetical protein